MRDADFAGDRMGPPASMPVERRMRPSLRMAEMGCVFAAIGTVAAFGLWLSVPPEPGLISVLTFTAVATMLAMAVICALQAWVWVIAMSNWRHHRQAGLVAYMDPSWTSHLASYPIMGIGLVANCWLVVLLANLSAAWWCALVCGVCLAAAQASGAVEYFRLSGPRGSVAMHVRRLAHHSPTGHRGANR